MSSYVCEVCGDECGSHFENLDGMIHCKYCAEVAAKAHDAIAALMRPDLDFYRVIELAKGYRREFTPRCKYCGSEEGMVKDHDICVPCLIDETERQAA